MKTARKMGIPTVAVYSEVDRNAPHVKYADEAVLIGKAPSSESYLSMEKIIAAAKGTGAEGIHPGYGFLSENPVFAQMVADKGYTFIGPSPHSIRIMGNKLAAKEAVRDFDIPMVPGTGEAITEVARAIKIAEEIGLPVLIKATAGGGGKGMRIVDSLEGLPGQMERAISEADAAFGDDAVFIEKYIESPRHIEIQVLADTNGNTIHLFERECSIQRRHQKVVEEAPSSIVTPEIRSAMGRAAVKVAKACNYIGAGTVEFLMDADMNFYFLEMNTRLQVEHPVTECITGIDLVEQQIRIARGESLGFAQEDLDIRGHAVELRIYAEDPLQNFMPGTGTLTTYQKPEGPGIRVDDGFGEGMQVPVYYDPLLSKLITHGRTREEAIQLMIDAIGRYTVRGVATTLPFGKFVCEHPAFRSGDFDTHFVQKYYSPELLEIQHFTERTIAARMGLHLYLEDQKILKTPICTPSNWHKRRMIG